MPATRCDDDPVFDLGPVTAEEEAFALGLIAWEREVVEAAEAAPSEWCDEADIERPADAAYAVSMLARDASTYDVLVIADLDVAGLGEPALALRVSRRIDQVTAMLAAKQAELLASVAGATPSGDYSVEVHAETEVALARTISPTMAGLEIETARALATTFPAFHDALARGEVSMGHCRRLVEATRLVCDAEALARIGAAALPKARSRTVGLFGRDVRRLIARFDPDAGSRRREAVRTQRDVSVTRLDDGLGRLIYVDEWSKVDAVGRRIRTAGRATQVARKRAAAEARATASGSMGSAGPTRGQGRARSRRKTARKVAAAEVLDQRFNAGLDEHATAAGCRADALLAIVLGREQDDGTVVLDPGELVRVECQVVMDLATLRGEAEGVALLNGQPVPADVGREWARLARTYRRMVTDPVTGHLLDKGRAYMGDDVRGFVLARDGGCRIPVCGISHPDRLQVDHADPHPHGATSSANLGALSTTHHQLKTQGYLDISDSRADGSATLTTLWGQTIVIPPRAYLDDPDPCPRRRTDPPDPADDPPPF